jgi:hypothetical protein
MSCCLCNMEDIICDGNLEQRIMFHGQLNVVICESHYKDHINIMLLKANGFDIEKVLELTPEQR